MTLPGRPTSPPPDRPSVRATVTQAIADHPNPWPQLLAGALGIAAGAYLVYKQYPAALADKIFDGIPFGIGICVLPTMPTWIAAGAKKIGPALGSAISAAKGSSGPKDGGAPPSGPADGAT